MSECKVSVLMITYNHEDFIEQAIESVLMQETDFVFELIIANDKSRDNTSIVINQIINHHPKSYLIKFLDNVENLGPNANYINAYNSSKGKYIAVCEGDDFWGDKNKLQCQHNFLEEHLDYVLCYHDAICIDKIGNIIPDILNGKPPEELSELDLMKGMQPLPLTTFYRKLPMDIPQVMGSIVNGDTFLISLLGNYGKGRRLKVKPASYRHHIGGIWSLKNKEDKFKAKIQLFTVLNSYYDSLGNDDMSLFYKNQLILHQKMLLSSFIKQAKFKSSFNLLLNNFQLFLKN